MSLNRKREIDRERKREGGGGSYIVIFCSVDLFIILYIFLIFYIDNVYLQGYFLKLILCDGYIFKIYCVIFLS